MARETQVERLLLARALLYLDRDSEARALVEQLIALGGNVPDREFLTAHNIRAQLLQRAGHIEEARAEFAEVLRLTLERLGEDHPNWTMYLSSAAKADLAANDLAAARTKLERALPILLEKQGKQHPRTLDVVARLSDIYEKLGLPDKAAEVHASVEETDGE